MGLYYALDKEQMGPSFTNQIRDSYDHVSKATYLQFGNHRRLSRFVYILQTDVIKS